MFRLRNQECRLLQDYQIHQLLGVGGFGVVLKCQNKLESKSYAIKITTDGNGDGLREVFNLVQIPVHKNLVQYHTCWKDSLTSKDISSIKKIVGTIASSGQNLQIPSGKSSLEILCIQMELCGQDLRKWLDQQKIVKEEKSMNIFIQLVKGVEHIHSRNLIHRDLKPENIFFSQLDTSVVKIGDLGIATGHSSTKSLKHTTGAGTPLYFAPEQESQVYGKSVDIYALGIIFFELLYPSIQPGNNYGSASELISAITSLKYKQKLPSTVMKSWPFASSLIIKMLSFDSKERPNFSQIYSTFSEPKLPNKPKSSANGENQLALAMGGLRLADPKPSSKMCAYTSSSSSASSGSLSQRSYVESTYSNQSSSVTHYGVFCNGCGLKNITGVRYKCSSCPDYDLCEKCEKRSGLHPEYHILYKIKDSANGGNGLALGLRLADNFPPSSSSFTESEESDDSTEAEDCYDYKYRSGAICNICRILVNKWYHCEDCTVYNGGYDCCKDCYHTASEGHKDEHYFTKYYI